MKRHVLAAASMVIFGLAAGCGGSSSHSEEATTAIAGKVADGYLVGATVFMDKNGNYQLDGGEPSATTDSDGAYTLTVDASEVGLYHIVALAIEGVTVDKDTNLPVSSSYLLSLPRHSVSGTVSTNFISPMSSQLREMMETGNYATLQEAMEALRVKLGMPAGTNMMGDYIAGDNRQMHGVAQNMASLMGSQAPHLFNRRGSSDMDVNRYRGMMGMIFSNMSSVRTGDLQTMVDLRNAMTTRMGSIPTGQPFRNMSTNFRGAPMGSGRTGVGMMGSNTSGMMR